MKECKHCLETKKLEDFVKSTQHKDGYQNKCKVCWNEYRREWSSKNREKRLEQSAKYFQKNREYYKLKNKEWLDNNRERARAHVNSRRKRLKQATPSWQDKMEFLSIYQEAQDKGLEVDHIVPINHPKVCGLHVPWNLQLLSHEENLSKGNRFYG